MYPYYPCIKNTISSPVPVYTILLVVVILKVDVGTGNLSNVIPN